MLICGNGRCGKSKPAAARILLSKYIDVRWGGESRAESDMRCVSVSTCQACVWFHHKTARRSVGMCCVCLSLYRRLWPSGRGNTTHTLDDISFSAVSRLCPGHASSSSLSYFRFVMMTSDPQAQNPHQGPGRMLTLTYHPWLVPFFFLLYVVILFILLFFDLKIEIKAPSLIYLISTPGYTHLLEKPKIAAIAYYINNDITTMQPLLLLAHYSPTTMIVTLNSVAPTTTENLYTCTVPQRVRLWTAVQCNLAGRFPRGGEYLSRNPC